jgi:tRNA-Thr(GGU) m(6)t(6)A37 methyltransferase TsaA
VEIKPIATFHSPFRSKFGIPKQSGLVEELEGKIVFEPQYRNADYIRGIEGYDYIWLIWEFSANKDATNSPLVRPPLLGGNMKKGVFATRSPFRPNLLGLSSVRLLSVDLASEKGPILHVSGADIMDGTPIYDIKPYITYADSHAHARSGFVDSSPIKRLKVVIPETIASLFNAKQLEVLRKTLELDP